MVPFIEEHIIASDDDDHDGDVVMGDNDDDDVIIEKVLVCKKLNPNQQSNNTQQDISDRNPSELLGLDALMSLNVPNIKISASPEERSRAEPRSTQDTLEIESSTTNDKARPKTAFTGYRPNRTSLARIGSLNLFSSSSKRAFSQDNDSAQPSKKPKLNDSSRSDLPTPVSEHVLSNGHSQNSTFASSSIDKTVQRSNVEKVNANSQSKSPPSLSAVHADSIKQGVSTKTLTGQASRQITNFARAARKEPSSFHTIQNSEVQSPPRTAGDVHPSPKILARGKPSSIKPVARKAARSYITLYDEDTSPSPTPSSSPERASPAPEGASLTLEKASPTRINNTVPNSTSLMPITTQKSNLSPTGSGATKVVINNVRPVSDLVEPVRQGESPTADVGDVPGIICTVFKKMRNEQSYLVQNYLRKSRLLQIELSCKENDGGVRTSSDVFKRMTYSTASLTKSQEKGMQIIIRQNDQRQKAREPDRATKYIQARSITWAALEKITPNYSYSEGVTKNTAAPNIDYLPVLPFYESRTTEEELVLQMEEHYNITARSRSLIIKSIQRAIQQESTIQLILEKLKCKEETMLYYLLMPREHLDGGSQAILDSSSQMTEFARKRNNPKEKVYDEIFWDEVSRYNLDRDKRGWLRLFDTLPTPHNTELEIAKHIALVLGSIQNTTIWSYLRQRHFPLKKKIRNDQPTDLSKSLLLDIQKFACRSCHVHDCDEHQALEEIFSQDESSFDGPQTQNIDKRVQISVSMTPSTTNNGRLVQTSREEARYDELLRSRPVQGRRPRYIPCYHPGRSCSQAFCLCFRNKLFCEKSCGCAPTCSRRFKGCSCKTGNPAKTCFQDSRCECFRCGRECDVDLCRSCGVTSKSSDVGVCQNAGIQKGQYKRTMIGKSPIHGLGLFALESIERNEMIGEYNCETVHLAEMQRRATKSSIIGHSYFFTLCPDLDLDGLLAGTRRRFVNDGVKDNGIEAQNVMAVSVMCNMMPRIAYLALRNIAVGEELFINYGRSYWKAHPSQLKHEPTVEVLATQDTGDSNKGLSQKSNGKSQAAKDSSEKSRGSFTKSLCSKTAVQHTQGYATNDDEEEVYPLALYDTDNDIEESIANTKRGKRRRDRLSLREAVMSDDEDG